MLSIGHDGKITTSWYMKPIASGRCLNFLSCHPRSQKINTAEGVIFRILSLSTNLESPEVKNQIRTVLRNNNYPTKLINILYNRVILKIKKSNSSDTSINPSKDSENNKKHMSIHYVPGLSEKLARNLESEIGDLSIAFRTRGTLCNIYRKLKDKTPKWQRSNVIYCIKCQDCGKVYVGKTEQHLKKTIGQHKCIANKMKNLLDRAYLKNNSDIIWISDSESEGEDIDYLMQDICRTSAIAQHMKKFQHSFDFDNVEILDIEYNSQKLSVLELLYINKLKNVNKIQDLDKLSSSYYGILKLCSDNRL
jgi:transposase-like protein